MGHYGQKDATLKDEGNGDIIRPNFQVTDATKPLLAVRRLVEEGSLVQLGPGPWQNYIMNVEAGKTIKMEKSDGTFVVEDTFATRLEGKTKGFSRQAW